MSREMANVALDMLPDEAIEAVHLASLALLERAGVKVESPGALSAAIAQPDAGSRPAWCSPSSPLPACRCAAARA